MRKLIFLALLLPIAATMAQAEEIGAFFTKVNAYAYSIGPNQGRRTLVRPRQALAVLDLQTDGEDKLWLQIIYAGQQTKLKGEGWTPLAPHELLSAGTGFVEIYAEVVETEDKPISKLMVPAMHLELLNITKPSNHFAQLTWQKVRYETKVSSRPWIRATSGVFRPGKNVAFLGRVYVELVSRNLEKGKLNRLISGVVRVGDSPWDVERALGKPLKINEDSTIEIKRVTWEYSSLVVRFENEVVEQVN